MNLKYTSILTLFIFFGFIGNVNGQVSIDSESFEYIDNFTGFQGSADPINWVTFDVANTSTWIGTGSGTGTPGGKYSFGNAGSSETFEGSLGFLPSSSRSINAVIEFINNTGSTITSLDLSYVAEHWRSVSGGRKNGWAVSYSIDGGSSIDLNDLTYIAPNDIATGGGPHSSETLSQTVSGLIFENGSTITITFFGDNGTGSGSRQGVAIDDFSLSNIVLEGGETQYTREITGSAGWRMLSFPITGGTAADISDDTAIQGVTGGANATMDSNFQIYNSGSDVTGFEAPTDISTPFGDGLGFITYFYNNTDAGSSELPITLDIAGEEPSSDVSVTLNTEGDFLLAGNPFASNLDLNALKLETGTLNENVTIWDNSASSYVTVDRTAGAIASTWQGFWIEYSTGSTNLTIPTSAKTETAATASYFGKANSDDKRSDIKFELISETTSDKAIRLSLRENAILGWDAADASKFQPLLTAYATLGFVGDDKLKSVYSAPYNLDEDVTIPMQLDVVGVSGEFELSWSGMASLPSGFSVMLNDAEEGTSVNLSEVESYTFMIASESAEKAKPLSVLNVKDRTTMKAKGNTERFSLTLMPSISVSNEPNGSQPEVFKLEQNYPNPFNPTTNISFAVANAGNVEISVYNVMGQKVATVLNENRAVGSYQVTFDASSLSSGIYYYRLQSAGQALTRQMTLIK